MGDYIGGLSLRSMLSSLRSSGQFRQRPSLPTSSGSSGYSAGDGDAVRRSTSSNKAARETAMKSISSGVGTLKAASESLSKVRDLMLQVKDLATSASKEGADGVGLGSKANDLIGQANSLLRGASFDGRRLFDDKGSKVSIQTGQSPSSALSVEIGGVQTTSVTVVSKEIREVQEEQFKTVENTSVEGGGLNLTKVVGTKGADAISSVAAGSGGAFVTGGTADRNLKQSWIDRLFNMQQVSKDAVVTQYKSDGSVAWSATLGTDKNDYLTDVAMTEQGSVYAVGYSDGSVAGKTNNGGTDGFLTKFKTSGADAGQVEWSVMVGGKGKEQITGVATGADGSIFVTGTQEGPSFGGLTNAGRTDSFVARYDSSGKMLFTRAIGSKGDDTTTAITTGSDGSVYVVGYTDGSLGGQQNAGGKDVFITKLNADGSTAFTKMLGGAGDDYASGITLGSDGAIYIAGYTQNKDGTKTTQQDAFVTKLSSDGSVAFTKVLDGTGDQRASSVAVGTDGAIFVSGSATKTIVGQTVAGSYDAFITRFTADGTSSLTKVIGSSGSDKSAALSVSKEGSIFIAGSTDGALNGQTQVGGVDGFVSRLDPWASVTSTTKVSDGYTTKMVEVQVTRQESRQTGLQFDSVDLSTVDGASTALSDIDSILADIDKRMRRFGRAMKRAEIAGSYMTRMSEIEDSAPPPVEPKQSFSFKNALSGNSGKNGPAFQSSDLATLPQGIAKGLGNGSGNGSGNGNGIGSGNGNGGGSGNGNGNGNGGGNGNGNGRILV